MRPGIITNTAIFVEVTAVAVSECPECHRTLEKRWRLTEESLVTGNHTQTAAYAVKAMRAEVEEEKLTRGWQDLRCGRCADPLPESGDTKGSAR